MKIALITGITGQDGSYLAEFLLSKGYEVHGMIRRSSSFNTQRIDHIYVDKHNPKARLFLHYGDLSDSDAITDCVYSIAPDEIYNLGAQSHVKVSFNMPEYTGNVSGLGTTRLLEAIKKSGINTRFYQASSSEMFGAAPPLQHEKTPFHPRSPYAVAKLYSFWMTVNYRESYNLHASNGILFNHESPRRGETFVTKKITRALANLLSGNQKTLFLGNLDAKRDWGFAPEFAEAMWLILQNDKPDDFVIGTGESHSIREFVEKAFSYAGVIIEWRGSGLNEKGIVCDMEDCWKSIIHVGQTLIEIDPSYFRPAEVNFLQADITKAKTVLKWEPRINFDNLVKIMVDYDMKNVGLPISQEGIKFSLKKGFQYTSHEQLNFAKALDV